MCLCVCVCDIVCCVCVCTYMLRIASCMCKQADIARASVRDCGMVYDTWLTRSAGPLVRKSSAEAASELAEEESEGCGVGASGRARAQWAPHLSQRQEVLWRDGQCTRTRSHHYTRQTHTQHTAQHAAHVPRPYALSTAGPTPTPAHRSHTATHTTHTARTCAASFLRSSAG